ncbi:DUF3504 domain-containing protein, partial [Nephila pilipes]
MVLKSSEAGKEYCSTECLGKWLATEHKEELQPVPQGEGADKKPSNNTQADSSSNPKIQKLLTLCSSANLLIPFPSICKDFTAPAENAIVPNGVT